MFAGTQEEFTNTAILFLEYGKIGVLKGIQI
jgi:hypothetical protein